MNLKKSIRRILKEESKIPLYVRRRVDMNEIMTQFEESLESVSNLYIKKRDKLKSMNSQKFTHLVISHLVTEVCEKYLQDNCMGYFDTLWGYLEDYFQQKIKERFFEIELGY